jgi:hypothetical protein
MTPTEPVTKYRAKTIEVVKSYDDLLDAVQQHQEHKKNARYDLNRAQRRALKKAKK